MACVYIKEPKEIDIQDEVRKVEVYESLTPGEVHSTPKKASVPSRKRTSLWQKNQTGNCGP